MLVDHRLRETNRLVAAVKQYIVGNIIYIALIALGILILIEAFALACGLYCCIFIKIS